MASSFDDEWIKRLSRQMEDVRRALAGPAEDAMRHVRRIEPHLIEMNRRMQPQLDAVARAISAWQESPTQRAAQLLAAQWAEQADQVRRAIQPWQDQLPRIMENAARAAEAFEAAWQVATPTNWRDLDFDEIESALDLMEESGWALVWTPRVEIIRSLIETPADEREEKLLAHEHDVLDDLAAAVDGITRTDVVDLASASRESIETYRTGHFRASQALSTVIFTTLFHRYVDARFADGRTNLEPLDPRDATIANMRAYCVLRAVLVAIDTYFGRADERVPTRFNRHASTHRLAAEQYTKLNALAAMMLTSSLLSEVDARGHLLPMLDE